MNLNTNVNINGILNLYKPSGVTSHDMVNFIRRTFHIKKVGHAGTLDPLACGVLPIMTGNATKLSQILTDHDKIYKAKIKFGLTTDTQDITGKILSVCEDNVIPSENEIVNAVSMFNGDIQQIPPMYSAIKVNGKKLYNLAREGLEVQRETRNVRIYDIDVSPTEQISEYVLTVSCSKGTYIRTLCHDIGQVLKCGAVMTELKRIRCNNFSVENSVTCEELKNACKTDIQKFIIPVEKVLHEQYDKQILLDSFNYKLIRNGVHVSLKQILSSAASVSSSLSIESDINKYSVCDKVLLYTHSRIDNTDNNKIDTNTESIRFFSLGEIIWSDSENRLLLKSSIIFE